MAEQLRVQVALDETVRDRLRPFAGQGQTALAFMIGRLVETGLAERKRLLAGIVRRLELAQRGGLTDSERAGAVQVPMSPKLALQLGELGTARRSFGRWHGRPDRQSGAGRSGLVDDRVHRRDERRRQGEMSRAARAAIGARGSYSGGRTSGST